MTPTQRRELERLIDQREKATMDRVLALHAGRSDDAEVERWKTAYRALQAYLDEATDYRSATSDRSGS